MCGSPHSSYCYSKNLLATSYGPMLHVIASDRMTSAPQQHTIQQHNHTGTHRSTRRPTRRPTPMAPIAHRLLTACAHESRIRGQVSTLKKREKRYCRTYLVDDLNGALHHVFREAFHHVRSPPRVRYLSDSCFLLACKRDQHTAKLLR